jgi:hypothetical protein
MASSSPTIPLPPLITGWFLPLLGVLLTGLGVVLLSASVRENAMPTLPARSIIRAAMAGESMPDRGVSTTLARAEAGSGAGDAIRAAPARSPGPANCLGADLATGQRAESAHLATVPLLRPADCGDLRDVILATADLTLTRHTTDIDSRPTKAAEEALGADSIDLVAAALFGPPDRQPQAKLKEVVLDGKRGRARVYLETTAATRVLTP